MFLSTCHAIIAFKANMQFWLSRIFILKTSHINVIEKYTSNFFSNYFAGREQRPWIAQTSKNHSDGDGPNFPSTGMGRKLQA